MSQPCPPNARHQPPRTQLDYRQVSRLKATLFAVGCMALLDCAVHRNVTFLTIRAEPLLLDAPEKRYQVLRVVGLLGAPKNIVNLQVLRREVDEFGNRYALSGFGV